MTSKARSKSLLLLLILGIALECGHAFSIPETTALAARKAPVKFMRYAQPTPEQEESVQVGTGDYYKGFVSRSLDEEPVERVTGDAILGPTFKFVGGFAVVITALFLGFMASNGLI